MISGYISCYYAYRDCLRFSFIYLLQKELDKVAKECSPDEAYQTLLYAGGIPDELSSYQKYKVYSEIKLLYCFCLLININVEILFLIYIYRTTSIMWCWDVSAPYKL